MKAKHKRLIFIFTLLLLLAIGITIILKNLNDNIVFYYTPTEASLKQSTLLKKEIRIGGLVKEKTYEALFGGRIHKFYITDGNKDILVHYNGMLPPMFRENQGVVAKGELKQDKLFQAKELLTKHDEKYMPPELSETLDKYKK